MKGRSNFLCREKVYRMADQPMLKGLDELDWFHQIRDWEKVTDTGDRAELNFLPDDSDLWARLDARRDACSGQKCPEFSRCFLTAMHQRAAEADLIIVNHHLFFADLALKQDDFGSVLPEYGAVIFDEAHEIEDVASEYFGRQISNYRFDELGRDAEVAVRVTKTGGAGLLKHVARTRERARSFFEAFPAREGRFPFDKNQRAGFLEQNREAYDALLNALKSLEAGIASLQAKPEELLNIARRSMELRAELSFLFESSEGNFVYWFERRAKGVFVAATPIDVSTLLRERLFEPFETIILTSATLAVGGRFDFLKQRLGVNMASERVLESEFDFSTQALLYVPALPDVRDPGFPERAAQEITRLLEISRGRAFCLFTSYSQMNDQYERVRTRVRFPVLLQGSAPRSALLEKFRESRRARSSLPLPASGKEWMFAANSFPASLWTACHSPCLPIPSSQRASGHCRTMGAILSRNIRCPRRCWRSSRVSVG